jgi:pimeloyl-ACP methyl ester carboxylesterase
MNPWLALAGVAAACLILALLERHARAYAARAEAKWPPQGRFIVAEGVRLHVVETGPADAPPLLLIHGALANLRELTGPLAPLEADYRLIAYDRPGLGFSDRPRGAAKLALQARIAAAVLAAAQAGPALIVAHSLGCAVALRLALDRPELVRGMVLIAPASHPYPGANAWWARLAAAPLIGPVFSGLVVPLFGPLSGRGGMANNFTPASVPKQYWDEAGVGLAFRARAFRASAQDVVATRSEFAAQAPGYGEILAPTIVVASDRDRVASTRIHARPLAFDLAAGELVTAPGTGHMPHRLRADLVLAAVRRVDSMAQAPAEG